MCIGIIILIIVVVGGIFFYAYFAGAVANRERISWARTLNNLTLPELEKMLDELEKQRKALQKQRLISSGYKRNSLDVKISDCAQRIKILKSFIEEQSHGK